MDYGQPVYTSLCNLVRLAQVIVKKNVLYEYVSSGEWLPR